MWKCIESILTLKDITSFVHRTISQGENLITNPYDITNSFSNYFSCVAGTAKENINYSHKRFSDYLNNQCKKSIFIQPTDSDQIDNIISTLNMKKFSGRNSIPYKILNLFKKTYFKTTSRFI